MWCVSVHTAQAHLLLIKSQGYGIILRATGIWTSKATLTKGAAGHLMFLQKGMFKWVSRYCKTQSSLFLCSESICQCLGYVPFFFSLQELLFLLHMLYMAYRLPQLFWWNCFLLDPIISCDHFSWTSLFWTTGHFWSRGSKSCISKAFKALHHLHCCWSCLVWTKWASGCLWWAWERRAVMWLLYWSILRDAAPNSSFLALYCCC